MRVVLAILMALTVFGANADGTYIGHYWYRVPAGPNALPQDEINKDCLTYQFGAEYHSRCVVWDGNCVITHQIGVLTAHDDGQGHVWKKHVTGELGDGRFYGYAVYDADEYLDSSLNGVGYGTLSYMNFGNYWVLAGAASNAMGTIPFDYPIVAQTQAQYNERWNTTFNCDAKKGTIPPVQY